MANQVILRQLLNGVDYLTGGTSFDADITLAEVYENSVAEDWLEDAQTNNTGSELMLVDAPDDDEYETAGRSLPDPKHLPPHP